MFLISLPSLLFFLIALGNIYSQNNKLPIPKEIPITNTILSYVNLIRKNNKIIITNPIGISKSKKNQLKIQHSHNHSLKSLEVLENNNHQKFVIINNPILAMYIPWRNGYPLDPAEFNRILYFLEVALKRGYNKFIIQIIAIKNSKELAIAHHNGQQLSLKVQNFVQDWMIDNKFNHKISIKYELIGNSNVQSITEVYNGFFIIANTMDYNSIIAI